MSEKGLHFKWESNKSGLILTYILLYCLVTGKDEPNSIHNYILQMNKIEICIFTP